jgi:hypothetical protein
LDILSSCNFENFLHLIVLLMDFGDVLWINMFGTIEIHIAWKLNQLIPIRTMFVSNNCKCGINLHIEYLYSSRMFLMLSKKFD